MAGNGSNRGERRSGGRRCPACDRPMVHRHCKYVCPEHGVVYDCSDTFY
ncbi:MAG: HVO_2523 family zinc finger protein [Haloarculaceae archaeon]